ncbi:MAG TPA: molybdate ABC transporter substrate-binding protein [Anaerolineales bacterium]|nr:molybdate ABC transporter substrate-binding protein [Anaerolineales bacterium]
MKRFLSLILLSTLLVAGCAPAVNDTQTSTSEARALTVFAAASLTDAFTEIGANFEAANPGVTTTFNFAGSQALRTQIEEGAPADVFASANQTEMEALVISEHVVAGTPQVFLSNKLVVVVPADNPAALENLEGLARSGVKLVIAAEEVPVGKYTREALNLMNDQFGSDFKDKLLANVVSNEDNVRQILAKVQLGEADAGIVYMSDAVSAPELQTIEIPNDLNVIATYPIAALLDTANSDLATAFVEYVLSSDGQAILEKWGFGPPE